MSDKKNLDPTARMLKSNNSTKQLARAQKIQQSAKVLQRKPPSLGIPSTINSVNSKNTSKESHLAINSPRYMLNTPLKLVAFTQSINNNSELSGLGPQDLKTERKDIPLEKSAEKSVKEKRYNDDSADYYKYWKKKANQYQQLNFTLHRLNSSLQQENQILKHKFERVEKKLLKMYEPEPTNVYDQTKNYEKLENYYRMKVDQMSKKIEEQKMHIQKQERKIKELSKYISENYQLKNILGNMEQKMSEMRSYGSKDSRAQSLQKMSDRDEGIRYRNNVLGVDYVESPAPSMNKSSYAIKISKKGGDNPKVPDRPVSGRKYM